MEKCTFDKAILQPGFKFDGVHLIEASAGTGKTFNIQNIYARLVMERSLKVSEIEVMTYTDAATSELHDRLHSVLKDLQCRLNEPKLDCSGKNAKDICNRNCRADALISCVPENRRSAARNSVELALLEFDNASISTIHGFCQRVLSCYAFDAGIRLAPEIENGKDAGLNALAEKWWRKRPADAPGQIQLNMLKNFVHKLGSKADYTVVEPDVSTPEGYLLKVAQSIVQTYDAEAPNREKMDFDDLLRLLRDALKAERPGSDALIAKLRQEFKAALIDEFQDTDPVQYEIFQRIFLDENPNPLFFVGDPKQAIYSFRGGDIYTYLKAKSVPGLETGSLNVNYRSTSHLMSAVNAMFMDEENSRTFGAEQIRYDSPVTVEKEPDLPRPVAEKPLTIVELPPEYGALGVADKRSAALTVMVEKIYELLTTENGGKPYTPKDIAILTNIHKKDIEIKNLLAKKNIPSVIRKAGNVFSSAVAADLRLFLLAVADPADKGVLLAALSTVFGGVRADELPEPDDPAALEGYLKTFSDLHEKWRGGGLAALVAELENSGYRERLAQRDDGERLLADAEQIWELSFSAIRKNGANADSFIAWLTDRINAACNSGHGDSGDNDESDAEEYARTLESDENAVKIMSIHVSKGLQFPVVFLPDCWHVAKPESFKTSTPVLSSCHENGKLIFSLSQNARSSEARELNLEKIRLLYVALTRAVERTIILTPPLSSADDGEPLPRLIGKLQRRCTECVPYEIVTAFPECRNEKYVMREAESQARPAQNAPDLESWRIPVKGSYSSLSPSTYDDDVSDDGRDVDPWSGSAAGRENVHPVFCVPDGAATGTCWHNILEKLPFDAGETAIRKIAERELSAAGIGAEHLDVTVQMLRKVLDYPLYSPAGEVFALNCIPWEKRLSEQEFNFSTAKAVSSTREIRAVLEKHWKDDPGKAEFLQAISHWQKSVPQGYMTGFIDLIFQYHDAYYVVDWKSNSLDHQPSSFDAAGVRQEMALHGYFFQYLLYAVVLHCHLKQLLGNKYLWANHFGGIRYYFLRGIAAGGAEPVFADRPSEALLNELASALGLEGK